MNSAFSVFNLLRSALNAPSSYRTERQREIITQLKFISTFQSGEKIDVKHLRVEVNNYFTPFKRLIYGESRDTTLNFITSTIERSFEILLSTVHSEKKSDRLFCKNMIRDLSAAIQGLKNIQSTYSEDKLFWCNIETIIDAITTKISEVKDIAPTLFEEAAPSVVSEKKGKNSKD